MAGGRPRIYESVEDLERAIVQYFYSTRSERKTNSGVIVSENTPTDDLVTCLRTERKNPKPTINGLALFLGFADKTTLYEYRDRPEFSYPVKAAISLIEQYHEERLSENSVAGAIFALKNMGWKDKSEQEITGKDGEPLQTTPSITIINQGPPLKEGPNEFK